MREKIIFGVLFLILLLGFYTKRKVYGTKYLNETPKCKVEKFAIKDNIQEGDLIFQTSLSAQSKPIQLATKSQYSHCGVIFKEKEGYFVLEAVQPVKKTQLDKWIARGENKKYVVKRLKNSNEILSEMALLKMKQIGQEFIGKNYDLTFEWTDDKIYCSELIWKIYKRAIGIEIGKLQKLKDFDLTNEIVKSKMKERYGNKIPKDEIVISPKAVFDSEFLETVDEN